MDILLEVGEKKVFASALDWPGWCRSGRDEAAAIQALLDYAPRYAAAVSRVASEFAIPQDKRAMRVKERVKGNATTDFGAPGVPSARDAEPVNPKELERSVAILRACWDAFDAAASRARHKKLSSGPRGGGRDVAKMTAHVLEADLGYLGAIGGKTSAREMKLVHQAFVEVLKDRASGRIPNRGPRGGVRWTAPFTVRRSAWHALDHAWEIEDRSI